MGITIIVFLLVWGICGLGTSTSNTICPAIAAINMPSDFSLGGLCACRDNCTIVNGALTTISACGQTTGGTGYCCVVDQSNTRSCVVGSEQNQWQTSQTYQDTCDDTDTL